MKRFVIAVILALAIMGLSGCSCMKSLLCKSKSCEKTSCTTGKKSLTEKKNCCKECKEGKPCAKKVRKESPTHKDTKEKEMKKAPVKKVTEEVSFATTHAA